MTKNNNKKILIINCGYPKAGSTYVIENVIRISKDINCINVNHNATLLYFFQSILNYKTTKFNYQYKKLRKILNKSLTHNVNFFGYERSLNISIETKKKFLFFKRLKKITDDLNLDLKLTIFLRDELEMITSHYKESYFKLIFKNITFISFNKFIKSILNKKEKDLIKNLNYKFNIRKLYNIINKKNIFINHFENLKNNEKNTFKLLMDFSNIKKFNINQLTRKPLNSSKNKKFYSLIKLRISDYFFLRKKLSISTISNSIEIFLKLIFFQNYLNRSVTINQKSRSKLTKLFKKNNLVTNFKF